MRVLKSGVEGYSTNWNCVLKASAKTKVLCKICKVCNIKMIEDRFLINNRKREIDNL